jgi:hypothetical protein
MASTDGGDPEELDYGLKADGWLLVIAGCILSL